MSTAFALSMTFLAVAFDMAVDLSRTTGVKDELQVITDAAALAGASQGMSEGRDGKRVGESYLDTLLAQHGLETRKTEVRVLSDRVRVEADLDLDLDLLFGSLIADSVHKVRVSSEAVFGGNTPPLLMALMLDVSGSMNGNTGDGERRVDVLRIASEDLFQALRDNGYDRRKLSVGIWPCAMDVRTDQIVPLTEGTRDAEDAIEDFTLHSGTNPATATELAVDALAGHPEVASRDRTMVLMSDGEIDDHLSSGPKDYTQRTLEACEAAKASGVRIVSVWMNAQQISPDTLLACASPEDPLSQVSTADCLADIFACRIAKGSNFHDTRTAYEFESAFLSAVPGGEGAVRIIR